MLSRSPGAKGGRSGLGVRLRALAVLGVTVAALTTSLPASAQDDATYYFRPGHPVYFDNGGTASGGYYGKCTGGYVIAGSDGTFIVTGNCHVIFSYVRGESRRFGQLAHSNGTTDLIELDPGDDAYQIVVDPLTGAVPADGQVVGYMPTAEQVQGTLVGKMGAGTGWTEGRITGWIRWHGGSQAICTDATAGAGDAGGPVWRWDQNGLRAVGIVVAWNQGAESMCYLPMQQVLRDWGAWLPAFGSTACADEPGRIDSGLPELNPEGHYIPKDSVPVGGLP